MLDFKVITLGDKPLFDEYLGRCGPQISEFTFTNLFMWRIFYKFRYALQDGLIYLVCVPAEGPPYAFMPIGGLTGHSVKRMVGSMKEYFDSIGAALEFRRVDRRNLPFFEPFAASHDDIVHDIGNSDYVYLSDSLATLAGKKYDGKRNHINRFNKEHTYEYAVMEPGHIGECKRIMAEWCAERNCTDHSELYCEKLANNELLDNFEYLGCKGALIKVDGRFEAFTVGEMLNGDTAVIHIEKANGSIHGLYTLTNQQFVKNEWNRAIYINREQDLGMEGLRKAKLSYHPWSMVDKYTVRIGKAGIS